MGTSPREPPRSYPTILFTCTARTPCHVALQTPSATTTRNSAVARWQRGLLACGRLAARSPTRPTHASCLSGRSATTSQNQAAFTCSGPGAAPDARPWSPRERPRGVRDPADATRPDSSGSGLPEGEQGGGYRRWSRTPRTDLHANDELRRRAACPPAWIPADWL